MNNVMIAFIPIQTFFFWSGLGLGIFGFILPKVFFKKMTVVALVELAAGPLHYITPEASKFM